MGDGRRGDESRPGGKRRLIWTVLVVLASLVGGVAALLVLFFLALQTNWGGTYFADFLFAIANPYAESETAYDELRGNFITRLELDNLRMYRIDTIYVDTVWAAPGDGDAPPTIRYVHQDSLSHPGEATAFDTLVVDTLILASIDTLRLRYNLLSLLRKQVHFREISLTNPTFWARREGGTWDLFEPFGADTSEAEPGQAPFTFRIDQARITNGRLVANYDPPRTDSVLQVEAFNLEARDVLVEDLISVRVDTLFARYSPPGLDYFSEVRARLALDQNDLNVTGLALESPASFVRAGGTLRLPGEQDQDIENIDFDLVADPIDFRDLHPFVPAINPNASAVIDLAVGGSSRILEIDASAQLSDGGSLSLTGNLSPGTEGPVAYNAIGSIRAFDPTVLTSPGSGETVLNGEFNVALAGLDLQRLNGTASAALTASRLGGMALAGARLEVEFEEGRAIGNLSSTWNGSSVSAEGTGRPFDEVPTYTLQGRTSNFNFASLGLEGQQSAINAAFRVDGTGINANTADIDASVILEPSTINDYAINGGDVSIRLAGGEVDYGLRFVFPDGLLAANGLAYLDDPFRFSIERGRFENVDVAALLGTGMPSSLNGTFRAQAIGSDPQTLSAEASLDMEPSYYDDYRLADGSFQLNMENGRAQLTALADLGDAGSFDFAAVTRPFDDVPTLNVTRGRFTNVDIGPLAGNPELSSDLNGEATVTVRGFDPGTMQLDGRLVLASSTINEQEISSAAADIGLRSGLLTFDGRVDIPGGDAMLAGYIRPFQDVPVYEISQGRFRNINLATVTGNPSLESRLAGTIAVAGRGFDPETMSLQGRIDLDASRINEQDINSAYLSGNIAEGTIDVDLMLSVPEGDTRLIATVQPFLDEPTYTVREGTFAGINVGALIGDPTLRTNLAGELSLTGRGFDTETLAVDGTVRLDRSVVNDATLERGTLVANISNGYTEVDADLVFLEGAVDVQGRGRLFDEEPTYALAGSVINVDVGDLVGTDTLEARFSAEFSVEGAGTDPATMTLEGRIDSRDAVYEGADVDTLHTQFRLADGVLRVDSLILRSDAADAHGSGVVALYDTTTASDLRFEASVRDLTPVRDLLAAQNLQLEEGRFQGRVYGRPGTLRFDAAGRLSSFIYNDIRIAEFDGTLAGEIGPNREINVAEVQGDFDAVVLPQIFIQSADIGLTYRPGTVRFDGIVRLEKGRTADLAGVVETAPDLQRIVLEELTLDLDQHRWELLQQATVSYGEEYRVRNLLLYSDDQQIALDGVVDPDGDQNLVMTLENVETAPFADIFGYEGLGGVINGMLMLTGPAEAPEMTGSLDASLRSFAEDVGDLDLALDYRDLRLQIDALLTHEDGSTLNADGYIPLDLRIAQLSEGGVSGDVVDRSVEFTITADSFGVAWVEPFLDPESVSEFRGRLTADINISGTIDQPVLDGTARYLEGRVGLPVLGLTYERIQANLVLDQNEVAVNDFVIRSGSGSVSGSGTILLPQLTLGEFNIDLTASEFLAVDSPAYRFVVNGDMVLSGTTDLPELQGNVRVISGDIFLTEETTAPELEQVELSAEDLLTVERRFGIHVTAADTSTFDLYNALAMELDVNIERNTWIRSQVNPVMDIQFSGSLDLTKAHYEDINIFGTIEVVPQRSRIVQFGRRFDIASGTLTFNGPANDPRISITAEHEPRPFGRTAGEEEVVITLTLEGQMSDQLDLTLGSEPQMPNADILSYLATGRPASSGLLLGGGGEEVLQGLALDQITMLMEGIASAGLGLDVVTIDQRGGTPHLTAGSYVSSRLFLAVSQPIGDARGLGTRRLRENTPTITVEYEVTNWLLLQLMQHAQSVHLNLQWEYAY